MKYLVKRNCNYGTGRVKRGTEVDIDTNTKGVNKELLEQFIDDRILVKVKKVKTSA